MNLNKLITKKINEYALNGDANLLEQYGFLITMIAKEYAAEQLILSVVSNQRELLKAFLEHYEDTIDFLPAEPSELIDDYFNSL
jgi:hypothetical protein